MRIIDNKKDYYDYLVGIYGLDSETVYDRRGSISLSTNFSFNNRYPNLGTVIKKTDDDPYYNRLLPEKGKKRLRFVGGVEFPYYGIEDEFIIVIGNFAYSIVTDRYKEGELINGDNLVIKKSTRTDDEDCPIGLISGLPISEEYTKVKNSNRFIARNVILNGTWLAKLFPAEEVWKDIYDFIRSKKEKKIIDNRTDKEKIISAGFDVKTSFRNIK